MCLVSYHRPTAAELDKYQRQLERIVSAQKEQYCSPKWIEGYCEAQPKHYFDECHLTTGQMCKRGIGIRAAISTAPAAGKKSFLRRRLGSGWRLLRCPWCFFQRYCPGKGRTLCGRRRGEEAREEGKTRLPVAQPQQQRAPALRLHRSASEHSFEKSDGLGTFGTPCRSRP